MNTTGVVAICVTAVAAGLIAVAWLGARRVLRALDGVVWNRYTVTLAGPSLRIGPAPSKAAPSVPARAPEKPAERPAPAPVPQGEAMTRAQAAALLGVPLTTLKSNEAKWGIERAGTAGPRGSVMYTAGSVSRYQASRDGSAS